MVIKIYQFLKNIKNLKYLILKNLIFNLKYLNFKVLNFK